MRKFGLSKAGASGTVVFLFIRKDQRSPPPYLGGYTSKICAKRPPQLMNAIEPCATGGLGGPPRPPVRWLSNSQTDGMLAHHESVFPSSDARRAPARRDAG